MTKTINNSTALKLIKDTENLLIIDVRRFMDFKESKIENAVNLPVEDIEYDCEDYSEYKEKPVLVYCKVGNKSTTACQILEEAGFTNLYNLRGGILAFEGNIVK